MIVNTFFTFSNSNLLVLQRLQVLEAKYHSDYLKAFLLIVIHLQYEYQYNMSIVMGLRSIIMESSSLSLLFGNTCDYILLANHLSGRSSSGPVIVPGLASRHHVVVS